MEILTREQVAEQILAIEDPDEQAEAAALALVLYGEAPQTSKYTPYRFRPIEYIRDSLGWEPWKGSGPARPGQVEIIEAYTLALRQQFEKGDYEAGLLKKSDLRHWKPGQIIKFIIRMEAGHNTGKTKVASA